MKIINFLVVLALLWSTTTVAQVASVDADTQAEIQQTIEDFLYGASINDASVHRSFWAPALTYTSSRGTRYGYEQLISSLDDNAKLKPEQVPAWYSGEKFEFKGLGDAVLVNFTLVLSPVEGAQNAAGEPAKVERFHNTGVMMKVDGKWQAVNWNATAALP